MFVVSGRDNEILLERSGSRKRKETVGEKEGCSELINTQVFLKGRLRLRGVELSLHGMWNCM